MSAHGHHHDHHHLPLGWIIALNFAIAAAQMLGAWWADSLSLLADAVHNFSDVGSLLVTFAAHRLSRRQVTSAQTFGYRRAEIVAALINGSALIAVAVLICSEAMGRLTDPVPVPSLAIMGFAFAGLAVNAIGAFALHRRAQGNLNIRSAYLHLVTDALTSIAVLLGALAMHLWQVYWLDSVLSIAISFFLITVSWRLLAQTVRVLMQFTPPTLDPEVIAARIRKVAPVSQVYHVHLWALTDQAIHFEARISFREDLVLSQLDGIFREIEGVLKEEFGIEHTVLQPVPDPGKPRDLISCGDDADSSQGRRG